MSTFEEVKEAVRDVTDLITFIDVLEAHGCTFQGFYRALPALSTRGDS